MFHMEISGTGAMSRSRRVAYSRKLQLTDGDKFAFLTAKEVADLAKISLSHAYRIVKDPDKYLTGPIRELLTIKALGQIPGWEPGWRFNAKDQTLISPDDKALHCTDLENYALAQQLLTHWESIARDNEQAIAEQQQRIEELQNRLKLPRELRLYVNDSLKERRTLKIQSREHLKAVVA